MKKLLIKIIDKLLGEKCKCNKGRLIHYNTKQVGLITKKYFRCSECGFEYSKKIEI